MSTLTEAQQARMDDLYGRFPATRFEVLELREDRTAVIEFEDLQSAGSFLLGADGVVRSSFILRAAPDPYATPPNTKGVQ